MVSSRSAFGRFPATRRESLLLAGLNKSFQGIIVFLKYHGRYICKCGYVFGKHIRNTTLNHLKGLRHIMYMNGATESHYKKYISSQGLLRQKCKGRSKNKVGDHNWTCYNIEIQCIVKELVEIQDNYLHNHPKYKEIKDTIEACYVKTDYNNSHYIIVLIFYFLNRK